ncbi:MAG: extracellular matrix/biofilm biosynthesis regulator RemA family protein [Cetobacterium sp.]
MFINIGFGNFVLKNRVVAITSIESSPAKRLVREDRERGMLIEATQGRKVRSILIMDSDHVVTSANNPETLINRGE